MYNEYMNIAINEAKKALGKGEIPVGAIIVKNKKIISRAHNTRENMQNALAHAEISAIDKACKALGNWRLDGCDLYVTLEPCPMCMGTIVMGGIRNVVIGAKDAHGGAMGLLEQSEYLKRKNINVVWMPQEYGDVQRGFQALKELLYNTNEELLEHMMADFSVYNQRGVLAAKELFDAGLFRDKKPSLYNVEEIFDKLMLIIER